MVSYDIPDDRRRTRLHRDLKGFGMRVQYSVFECVLDEPEAARSQATVRRTIKRGEDHVRYYRLCENCVSRITVLGGTVTLSPTHPRRVETWAPGWIRVYPNPAVILGWYVLGTVC